MRDISSKGSASHLLYYSASEYLDEPFTSRQQSNDTYIKARGKAGYWSSDVVNDFSYLLEAGLSLGVLAL